MKLSIAPLHSSIFATSLPLVELFFFGDFILWKISSDDALSNNTSSSSDVESLPSMGEGKGSPIKASLLNCRDAAEEDEDDEDGKTVIRAVSKGGKPITPVMAEYV